MPISASEVLKSMAIALPGLLLLLLSCFSHVWLCATPLTAAHQAPPSLGFSRQEYWSGLPFPSPMHESEKWKVKVKSLSHVWLQPTRLLHPWDFPGESTGVGCHCLLRAYDYRMKINGPWKKECFYKALVLNQGRICSHPYAPQGRWRCL